MSDHSGEITNAFLDATDRNKVFLKIVIRHRGALVKYLYKRIKDYHLAEDLCQETLIRAYTALSTLEEPARIKSWLYSIAYHVSVDWLRNHSARKRSEMPSTDYPYQEGGVPGIDEILMEREEEAQRRREVERLWGMVRELPPIYREVFELRYRTWRPIAQISRRIGIPEGNVKVRLFRARRMLMNDLEH
ncbi:MAG: RNA polymerase sigma factor [Planctomycetota bacterium]|jgi:RNA polymerase sigma-70 factor (ECF subfamily)